MENYLIKKEVFIHESRAFKAVVAMNKKTKKDYLLTIYDLNYYKDKASQICQKIISICQTIKLYRCCQVFFDHEIYTLDSVRPSNIGTFLKKFIIVEPFPMVSLADYFDSRKINVDTVINGFSTIFKTLSTLHYLNIGYGCLSPLNIIVANGKFSFRPPNLSKYQCSCTPPPLVARKKYRFKTEIERYPHDRNLKNSKKTDCLCFGYLLCDYILYFGRNISFLLQKKYRNISLYFEKFSLPTFIRIFLKPDHDVFYDESIQRKLKQFLVNRKSLLNHYINHKYDDPSTYNEVFEIDKREISQPRSYSPKAQYNRHPSNYLVDFPQNKAYPKKNKVQKKSQNTPKKGQNLHTNGKNLNKSKKRKPNLNSKPQTFYNDYTSESGNEQYQINTAQDSNLKEYQKGDLKANHNKNMNYKNDDYQIVEYTYSESYDQSIQYNDDDFDYQNHPHIVKKDNLNYQANDSQKLKKDYLDPQANDPLNLKIDNVECYTINNNGTDLNNDNNNNNNNNQEAIIDMNLNNIISNDARFSAYSDAYDCNDSDGSFVEYNKSDDDVANHILLDSSDSGNQNNPNEDPIKCKADPYHQQHHSHHHKNANNEDDNGNNHQKNPDVQLITQNQRKVVMKRKDDKKKLNSDSDDDNNIDRDHIFTVKFKFEYDKSKYSEKKFSLRIFSRSSQKSEKHILLTINKKIGEIKHHHVNKEIKLNSEMYKKCIKDGITVCIMFNHAVHRDLMHLNLRNISFVPFYDNNLNIMFSVQTTFEENK